MNTVQAPGMVKMLISGGFSVTRIRMAILDQDRFKTWLTDVEYTVEDQ